MVTQVTPDGRGHLHYVNINRQQRYHSHYELVGGEVVGFVGVEFPVSWTAGRMSVERVACMRFLMVWCEHYIIELL